MFGVLFSSRSDKRAAVHTAPTADQLRVLRDKLTASIGSKEYEQSVFWLEQLEQREPTMPRWPHKRGDVLRLMHRDTDAFIAYALAVRLYVDMGKSNLANAMAKTALAAFPNASQLTKQLDAATLEAFYASCPTPSSIVLDADDLLDLDTDGAVPSC